MVNKSDKNTFFSSKRIFEFNGKTMDFTVPRVMGILNVTPDSFYDGSEHGGMEEGKRGRGELTIDNCQLSIVNLSEKVEQMVLSGAYIIDIGAVSTRPGAAEVSEDEERMRLIPVLKVIRKDFPGLIISIDTFRAEIARTAALEGADMINDISGGTFDPNMIATVADLQIPYIVMHIQGTPATMQVNPSYENVVGEVMDFLLTQARKLESHNHHKIILDPGFGFGKTVEHNYRLLSSLDEFVNTGYPVLAGLSRKSMINRVLNIKPAEALNGTTVLNTIALMKRVSILRVHDVKEAVEAVRLVNLLIS